jgi:hypothetical protein
MDFGTTIFATDQDVEGSVPIAVASPDKPTARPSSNSVSTAVTVNTEVASTDAIPPSIWQHWNELLEANISTRLYSDLVHLASVQSGRRSGIGLRADSLKSFLEFWNLVRTDAVEPELALAPDGSIHAEWFKSPHNRLDVRFASQKVFFGLFTSSNILEGVDRLETVAQLLKLHPAKPLSRSAR